MDTTSPMPHGINHVFFQKSNKGQLNIFQPLLKFRATISTLQFNLLIIVHYNHVNHNQEKLLCWLVYLFAVVLVLYLYKSTSSTTKQHACQLVSFVKQNFLNVKVFIVPNPWKPPVYGQRHS